MPRRASDSLVAVLIRIGLLLALAILLMAENAQAQPQHAPYATQSGLSSRSMSSAMPSATSGTVHLPTLQQA